MASKKEEFQKGDYAKRYADIVGSPEFKQAVNLVMLHFVDCFPIVKDDAEASAYCYRLEGARRFRNDLLNFATPPQATKPIRGDNLPHE